MDAYDCSLWRAFLKSPVSGILVLYTFIAAWFVGGLTAFHIYLIFTNQVRLLFTPIAVYCSHWFIIAIIIIVISIITTLSSCYFNCCYSYCS